MPAKPTVPARSACVLWILACLLPACGDSTPAAPEIAGRTEKAWVSALEAGDSAEKARALGALVRFENPPLALIAPYLDAREFAVRLAALHAIGVLGPEAAAHVETLARYLMKDAEGYDATQQKALRDTAMRSLGHIGPAALKPIRHLLVSRDAKLRARAVFTVRPFVAQLEGGTTMLLPLLKDDSWVVRREAARCLGLTGVGDELAAQALLEAIKDEHVEVVRYAAMAMGGIGGRSDREGSALAELLYAHQTRVRAAAAYGLGLMGEEASPYLERVADLLANDSKRYVRIHAARAHWQISGDPTEAITELKKDITCGDPSMCRLALQALTAMGPEAKDSVALLIELLGKPDLKRSAVAALGAIGPPARAALPALKALGEGLGDKDEPLTAELGEAIAAIEAERG